MGACKTLKVAVQGSGPTGKHQGYCTTRLEGSLCHHVLQRGLTGGGRSRALTQTVAGSRQRYRSGQAPFPLSPLKIWMKPLQLTCVPGNIGASGSLSTRF